MRKNLRSLSYIYSDRLLPLDLVFELHRIQERAGQLNSEVKVAFFVISEALVAHHLDLLSQIWAE